MIEFAGSGTPLSSDGVEAALSMNGVESAAL